MSASHRCAVQDQFLEVVQQSGDGRMDEKQFAQVVRHLAAWGVEVEPAAAFRYIDAKRDYDYRGTGVLSVGEVVAWIRHQRKDIDEVAALSLDIVKHG
eukprot:3846351-Prymnesium_polylepis.1